MATDLAQLVLDDSFVRALPADPDAAPVPRAVPGASYSRVAPSAVAAPTLLAWSDGAAALIGLARPALGAGVAAELLAGNRLLPGSVPYAARYGGHQFGHWAGQLGDGRAITLGEAVVDGGRWELQLKGAGRTAYSRSADGRAVLRSSLREFLCSEAMHALGVPTTRALSLVATGEPVVRDMFYDGRAAPEPGAIVCRLAPSFVRFGNFEIHTARGEHAALARLGEWLLTTHFAALGAPGPGAYAAWFAEVCRRTALMLVDWMRVGFVHGVMNTDNMSVLGLTLDYGPYGWLEGFDLGWTPNTTDAGTRRYCYGAQPQIGMWNLARFAAAVRPLVVDEAALEAGLDLYASTFEAAWRGALAAKLGLEALDRDGDDALGAELLAVLGQAETDMTIFFRCLADVPLDAATTAAARLAALEAAFYDAEGYDGARRERLAAWLDALAARVRAEGRPAAARRAAMNRVNPKYVARNYLAQQAIDAASAGDLAPLAQLMRVLADPYGEQPGAAAYAARRPEWARDRPGCSALSCSS